MNCPNCGAGFSDKQDVCLFCGSARPEKKNDRAELLAKENNSENKVNKVVCDGCGQLNPKSVKYCLKCGKKLVQHCNSCFSLNSLDTIFCGECGVELSKALFHFSDDEKTMWKDKFWEHYGVKTFYHDEGIWIKVFHPTQIKLSIEKEWSYYSNASCLGIPITNADWCMESCELNSKVVTSGCVFFGNTSVILSDFTNQWTDELLYQNLLTAEQDGDSIKLVFHENATVQFNFKIPRPSEQSLNRTKAMNFGMSFLGSIASEVINDKTDMDRRVEQIARDVRDYTHMSPNQVAQMEYEDKLQDAMTYIPLLLSFFQGIIKTKKKYHLVPISIPSSENNTNKAEQALIVSTDTKSEQDPMPLSAVVLPNPEVKSGEVINSEANGGVNPYLQEKEAEYVKEKSQNVGCVEKAFNIYSSINTVMLYIFAAILLMVGIASISTDSQSGWAFVGGIFFLLCAVYSKRLNRWFLKNFWHILK